MSEKVETTDFTLRDLRISTNVDNDVIIMEDNSQKQQLADCQAVEGLEDDKGYEEELSTSDSDFGSLASTIENDLVDRNIERSASLTRHNSVVDSDTGDGMGYYGSYGYEEDGCSSEGWQPMPTVASYDVYDDNGELAIMGTVDGTVETITSSQDGTTIDSSVNTRDGMFGYTRTADEEQAQRASATNKKTGFLFNSQVADSSAGSVTTKGSTLEFDREDRPQSVTRSTEQQLALTKTFLNEKEKFAYLGAVIVLANEMCAELAKVCLSSKNFVSNKKLAHRLNILQRKMGDWKSNIFHRLYGHMDVSEEEIGMIEKLSLHGISLHDLCKCLKVNRVIPNPWNKEISNVDLAGDVEAVMNHRTVNVDVGWTIVCDLFLLLVQDSEYDSRSRSLLINFAEVLDISSSEICEFEKQVIDILEIEQSTEDQVWDEKKHMTERRKDNRRKKLACVGIATIGGSLVLGLSGGLLAPVIGAGLAAGLSTVGVSSAAGFLTGVGGTTVVAVSSTVIGGNIGRKSMNRRMGSVRTFEFRPLHNNRRVNLIVSVSGWMVGKADDVRLPFSPVDPIEGDLYSLYWEPDMLKSTGQTINILASEIVTQTIQQILGATVLTALMAAIQVPNLLSKLGYLIDNPWSVSLDRAWAAGLILADTLISRNLGARPTTLVGFSLGSRVIYSCLLELSKRGAIGLVENVFLFGSPVVHNRDEVVLARAVVSGRFVNGYSDRDWILGYLFRATAGGLKRVAGISPIEDIEGIENMNCTELVEGHMAYRKKIPILLKKLGIAVLSEEFTEIDDSPDPEQERRQRKLVHDLQDVQSKLSQKKEKKPNEGWVSKWFKPKKEQWQEMYEGNLKGACVPHNHEQEDSDSGKDQTNITFSLDSRLKSPRASLPNNSHISFQSRSEANGDGVDKNSGKQADASGVPQNVADGTLKNHHALSCEDFGKEEEISFTFADDI